MKNHVIGAAAMVLCGAAIVFAGNQINAQKKANQEVLTGTAKGFGGDVTVTLTRENGAIVDVKISGEKETPEIGGAALAELATQLRTAGKADIDGVSGATITSTAVKEAAAQALGETLTAAQETAAETAAAEEAKTEAEEVNVEGGLQIGQVLAAAHGTKCFAQVTSVVSGDKIVAAYIDEYQFTDKGTEGITAVPNSDSDFGAGYADGKVLISKRESADYYSNLMTDHAKATVRIDDNYDAIQAFAAGKTISEIDAAAAKGKEAVDAVSGATLVDTAGYLQAIADAAKAAQKTPAVAYDGDTSALKLNFKIGAAHGTKGFSTAAVLTDGSKVILSWIDEFQFMPKDDATVVGVPNSDAEFADGYAADVVLASKRASADYYSKLMTDHAKATTRIDDNYDAIQKAVDGMTIDETIALGKNEKAVDSVSGATLADTAGYVALIGDAAKQ